MMARLKKHAGWLMLVVMGVAAYANSFTGVFVFDDRLAIQENLTIRQLATALAPPPNSPVAGRPMANLSLAVNYAISGLEPWSYHVFNLLVHLAAGLTLLGLVRQTLGAAEPALTPYLIAGLWLVHPLQTEAVTYVTQRTELLGGLFILLTVYCVARSAAAGQDPVRTRRWQLGAVGACVVGVGCKEIVAVAPLLALLYDRLFLAGSWRAAWRARRGMYVALAVSWLALAVFLLSGPRGGAVSLTFADWTPVAYARTQLGVVAHYLRLAVWPQPLVADYHDWPIASRIPAAGWLVIALLVATGWGVWRGYRWSFLGAGFFLVLAPSSSFIPIITEIAAERRMYLPLASVIAAAVLVTRRWAVWWTVPVVAVFVGLTIQRNEVYRSPQAFWADVLAKRPDNGRALTNYGNLLLADGKTGEAREYYRRALAVSPQLPEVHNNLAHASALLGDAATAGRHYAEALRLKPDYAVAHVNLARLLAGAGRLDLAIAHQAEAVRLVEREVSWRNTLAVYLSEHGDTAGAIRELRECVRREPAVADWRYNLGLALAAAGEVGEAREQLVEALRLEPGYGDAAQELSKLR